MWNWPRFFPDKDTCGPYLTPPHAVPLTNLHRTGEHRKCPVCTRSWIKLPTPVHRCCRRSNNQRRCVNVNTFAANVYGSVSEELHGRATAGRSCLDRESEREAGGADARCAPARRREWLPTGDRSAASAARHGWMDGWVHGPRSGDMA